MEMRQLQTLVTIAKTESFTQAAQSLGYAQSTITTQIQLLEEELGVKLFERIGRSVYLSSAGKKFVPYAKQILNLCLEAQQVVSSNDTPGGVITVGVIESFCICRLPQLYKEYHRRYPDVEVVFKVGHCNDFHNFLRENIIDIGFFIDRKICFPDLTCVLDIPEPVAILVSPEHPLASKQGIFPQDIEGETLILTEVCSYRLAFENMLLQAGVKPRSLMEAGSIEAIKKLTISSLGIALIPKMAAEDEITNKQLIELSWKGPSFDISTQVIHHKDKWLSTALQAFIDLTKELLQDD